MSKVKLICLPYAGGTAQSYIKWKTYLDKNIQLCPIELAGRGMRCNEKLYECFEEALEDVYYQVRNIINSEAYVLFGHSMGCWLIYELWHKINKSNFKKPEHMFLSGRRAPHIKKQDENYHTLPKQELKKVLLKFGGTPDEILENDDMFDCFYPIMKSDFKLTAAYKHIEKKVKIDCRLSIFSGKYDDSIKMSELISWKKYTYQSCKFTLFKGGHFFINENAEEVVNNINLTLKSYY